MKICTIHSHLNEAFEQLGHEVLALRPKPGVIDIGERLKADGFSPDLVFQQETLAKRTLLYGLHTVPCPKIFWSIDTHLNLWWHGLYGQSFDLVLTTQDQLVAPLEAMGVSRAGHLPWCGREHPFVPFAQRPRDMVFVGRVTPLRMTRGWMLDFLAKRFDLEHRRGVPYDGMIAACADGRLAPNESILGEVNFRLFEAASAGCAILNQTVDGDVSLLFEPGREVAVYEHALELETKARALLDDPAKAEAMGRAAHERVLREHLPAHRAAAVIDAARDLSPSRPDRRRDAAWRRAAALTFEAGLTPMLHNSVQSLLGRRADDPDILAAQIRLAASSGDRTRMAAMIRPLLSASGSPPLDLDLAASTAALQMGWPDAARQILERRKGLRPDRGPKDRNAILLAWCDLLEASGRLMRNGFPFDPAVHLPTTAFECLFTADLDPVHTDKARRLRRLTRSRRGLEMLHMNALSTLTLHHPDDWRLELELALTNLRAFRHDQGMQDLNLALDKARQEGEEDAFKRLAAEMDPSGLVLKALATRTPHTGHAG